MSKVDNVIDVLRRVDGNANFQFESANIDKHVTIAGNTATTTIDCSLGNVFTVNVSTNTTLDFDYSNITLTNDDAYTMTLLLVGVGQRVITWPATAQFTNNNPPTTPDDGETNIYVCFTTNGVDWYVFLAGEDMS